METVKHRRNIVGWVAFVVFAAFNAIMLLGAVKGLREAAERSETWAGTVAESQVTYWNTVGLITYFGIWLFGAALLGLMAYFARGRRVIERGG